MNQSGDVLLFAGIDGGDIEESGGYIRMTTGLETLVILSLAGGNDLDDGSASTEFLQWWGNDGEPEERKLRSEFHALLNGSPLNSSTILELKDAAKRDIERDIVNAGFAKSVDVQIRLSATKTVQLKITLLLFSGVEYQIDYEVTQ